MGLYYLHLPIPLFSLLLVLATAAFTTAGAHANDLATNVEPGVCREFSYRCLNNGTCVLSANRTPHCKCPDEWFGDQCQYFNCPPSSSTICDNGGRCEKTDKSFRCHCPLGFAGTYCRDKLDSACSVNPCEFGTCELRGSLSEYQCRCFYGFKGHNCSEVDHCADRKAFCANGRCESSGEGHRCVCNSGWQGAECDEDIDECLEQPCRNGGQCINERGSYHCNCPATYGGKHCEVPQGASCVEKSCLNGGKCHADRLECSCPTGFTGPRCERRNDPCVEGRYHCYNGGVCVANDDPAMASCSCLVGYTGSHCETKIDECSEFFHVCQNGGSCHTMTNGSYHCTCMGGFSGRHCEVNIDECADSLCYKGSTCVDGIGRYECVCAPDRIGVFCEMENPCYGERGSQNCRHGTCFENPENGNYTCLCKEGYEGRHCDIVASDECAAQPSPCAHGHCISTEATYYCECDAGYKDPFCSTPITYCQWDTCSNGGTCVERAGDYLCTCPPGYSGRRCESVIHRSESCRLNCTNGGVCRDALSPRCECPPNYGGVLCELEKPNPCEVNLCAAGSICVPSHDYLTHQCRCPSHMHGEHCEVPVPACPVDQNPCIHGVCRLNPSAGGNEVSASNSSSPQPAFSCRCFSGYEGELCDQESRSACSHIPCLNGGHCLGSPTAEGFQCICPNGYSGPLCENREAMLPDYTRSKRRDCRDSYCLNGGYCAPGDGEAYVCHCEAGFVGNSCEIDVNECLTAPCLNKGHCTDLINGYRCDCPRGWSGEHCELNVDNCKNIICANGGTCVDSTDDFECRCRRGYTGRYCEIFFDFDKYNTTDARDMESCERNGCDGKAGNGVCDQECNFFACHYDGGDCATGVTHPFGHCVGPSYCAHVFESGKCDQVCNNEACLFGNFKCSAEKPQERCSESCILRYGDGHCDRGCNTAACGWDGGDCDVGNHTYADHESPLVLGGELAMVLFVRGENTLLSTLKRFLVSLSSQLRATVLLARDADGRAQVYSWDAVSGRGPLLELKGEGGDVPKVSRERRWPKKVGEETARGVYVLLKVDVGGCRGLHPNVLDCFSHVTSVADYIGVANATRNLELAPDVKIHSVSVTPSRLIFSPLTIAATLILLGVVVLVGVQAPQLSRKRKLHAKTWMPTLQSKHNNKLLSQLVANTSCNNSAAMNPAEELYTYTPVSQYQQRNGGVATGGPIPVVDQQEYWRNSSYYDSQSNLILYDNSNKDLRILLSEAARAPHHIGHAAHYDASNSPPNTVSTNTQAASVASSSSGIGSCQQSPEGTFHSMLLPYSNGSLSAGNHHYAEPVVSRKTVEWEKGARQQLHRLISDPAVGDADMRSRVESLVLGGLADVNGRDEQGVTPLILSIKQVRNEVTQLLLRLNADPNAMDKEEKTPLHHAISILSTKAVHSLLQCRGDGEGVSSLDLDAISRRRETPLMRCVQMGESDTSVEIARLLIEAGADVNKTGDKEAVEYDRRTALHVAASLGNVRQMRLLLENNANIEATDFENRTPLFLAAANGHREAVEFLLQSGARADSTDMMDKDAALVAAENGFDGLCALIEEEKMRQSMNQSLHPNHRSRLLGLPSCPTQEASGKFSPTASDTKSSPGEADGGGENGDAHAVPIKRPRVVQSSKRKIPPQQQHGQAPVTKKGSATASVVGIRPPSASMGPSPPTLTPPNSDQSTSVHSSTPSPNFSLVPFGTHLQSHHLHYTQQQHLRDESSLVSLANYAAGERSVTALANQPQIHSLPDTLLSLPAHPLVPDEQEGNRKLLEYAGAQYTINYNGCNSMLPSNPPHIPYTPSFPPALPYASVGMPDDIAAKPRSDNSQQFRSACNNNLDLPPFTSMPLAHPMEGKYLGDYSGFLHKLPQRSGPGSEAMISATQTAISAGGLPCGGNPHQLAQHQPQEQQWKNHLPSSGNNNYTSYFVSPY